MLFWCSSQMLLTSPKSSTGQNSPYAVKGEGAIYLIDSSSVSSETRDDGSRTGAAGAGAPARPVGEFGAELPLS